ncbi:hypothetical protein ACFORG_08215 [Lutimaribacter marinistellae]|uniref:Uncharacterized protein n=1 Tax=Lutimaribacter marinistellae TaxID=1820329 RepID=A0ABV7TG84_9RHOB
MTRFQDAQDLISRESSKIFADDFSCVQHLTDGAPPRFAKSEMLVQGFA